MARTARTAKKKRKEPTSRLALFTPKRGSEQEFNFIISLTPETMEELIEQYESDPPLDDYGCVVSLGGAVYDNESVISGNIYVRELEEDEPPARKKRTTKRVRDDEDYEPAKRTRAKAASHDDDEDDEPPVKARARRSLK